MKNSVENNWYRILLWRVKQLYCRMVNTENVFLWMMHNFPGQLHCRTPLRDSRPEEFYKNVVLWNFVKLTGKNLCWSLFFNKVAGIGNATLFKKRLQPSYFPVNFTKFQKKHFLQYTSGWILLTSGRLLLESIKNVYKFCFCKQYQTLFSNF